VREGGFFPQALEKGLRSKRALTLSPGRLRQRALAALPVSSATGRPGLRAAQRHAGGSRR
jgi:hypothetical protein